MKSIDEYTPSELRVLADKKEQDQQSFNDEKLLYTAILNQNIYQISAHIFSRCSHYEFLDKKQIDEMVRQLENSIYLSKGTKFEYFNNSPHRDEGWYDIENGECWASGPRSDSGVNEWEEIYLENIVKV
jgi:hypothetical protein